MTTQFIVYNLALGHLEERALASPTENTEPKRVLDSYWSHCVAYCQEQGLWAFMIRTAQQDASGDVVPSFGYQFAFPLPADWVREVIVSTSPTFEPPLTRYAREAQYLFADFTPLYTSYVSNGPQYGFNLGAWPEYFTEYLSITLARMACKRITGSTDLLKGDDGLVNREKKARIDARGKDAMNLPPAFMPMSTWVKARRGFMGPNWDSGMLPPGGF